MNTVTFTGYIAEVIALRAERKSKTPSDYVLSFFDNRCIAPKPRKSSSDRRKSSRRKVQCTT